MLNIKVIEILLGVLLTLMIFQIYFKSFKTVSDKQILFVLILVLLCDKLFNRSKKEHSTSDLAPVTVDGAAAVFDADAFDHLNKIVKALAGEGTITIPGNVIIEGTLEVKGANLKFDKKSNEDSIISTTKSHLKIQRLDDENTEKNLTVYLSEAWPGSTLKSTYVESTYQLNTPSIRGKNNAGHITIYESVHADGGLRTQHLSSQNDGGFNLKYGNNGWTGVQGL